jgi:hypothetical protein
MQYGDDSRIDCDTSADDLPIPTPEDLEGIARELHDLTGIDCPVDALLFAELCGLMLRAKGGDTARVNFEESIIRYPLAVRHSRLHGLIAHELGHWALWRARKNHLHEPSARYLSGALMLPRERFLDDCDRERFDLNVVCALHPNVSAQMASVRMTQVSPATVTIWDCGKLHASYGQYDELDLSTDRALADAVLASERVERDGLITGYPMLDGRHRRVLCVRRAA